MGEPQLEFVWVGDDAIDPLQQAQTLQILVSAGIKTREEARAELGLGGDKAGTGIGKYNGNHDEAGRFATGADAVGVVGHPARKPRPQGVQVASNDAVMSDAGPAATLTSPPQVALSARPATPQAPSVTSVNVTCDELLESDYAICSSQAFADDHHYRGLCVTNALLRNRQCIMGFSLSPLLPY